MRCLTVCLGRRRELDALKAHVLRHAGQVPLFIEEVARQLVNRGILNGDAGRFATKAPWDALEIPPTVQGVIASRIDRLAKKTSPFSNSHLWSARAFQRACWQRSPGCRPRNCRAAFGRWKFWTFWSSRDGLPPRNTNLPTISFAKLPMIRSCVRSENSCIGRY